MLVRIISGVVLVALVGSAMYVGSWYLLGLCFLISVFGMYELYKVFGIELKLLGILGYLGAFAYYCSLLISNPEYKMFVIVMLFMALMVAFVFTFPKYQVFDVAGALLGVIYVAVMLAHIYQIRNMENGIYYVWLVFLCAWGSDSFAYLVGITIGKHKMSPVLSPKKSVEGAVGGVIGAAALGALFGAFVNYNTGGDYILKFAIACVIGAFISIVGDLTASAIKRKFEVKDYSKLIPGHGGIMDRFDSVIFTAPMIYWVLFLLK